MANRLISLCLVAVFALCALGCGSGVERAETFKVTGKVTLNGAPVDGATVVFHPESGPKAMGQTNAEGVYSLTTYDSGDGCVAGSAKVTISKADTSGDMVDDDEDLDEAGDAYDKQMADGGDSASGKETLPQKYSDLSTTPESRTVASSDNEFNFELTP